MAAGEPHIATNTSFQVDQHYHIPIRSIFLVSFVIVLLSLINIGSTTALYAVLSLSSLALYVSYLIPISLLIIRRLRKQHIELGPFNLGKFGLGINLFAFAFGAFIVIFLPFPGQPNVDAATLNWAGPVFGFLLLVALADWIFRGRLYYNGPRQEITRREEDTKYPDFR